MRLKMMNKFKNIDNIIIVNCLEASSTEHPDVLQ